MKNILNPLSFFRRKTHQKKGAALITVLAISTILLVFIQKIWVDSRLEHSSSYQELAELKSRYSARSGMELSLLRLFIYKEAEKLVKTNQQIASFVRPYMDLLWSVPFVWPLPIPENLSESDKKTLRELTRRSFLKESYNVSIYPEDGKIDINNLASPQTYLNTFTFTVLFNLLDLSLLDSPTLKEEYSRSDLEKILRNISDWVDENSESQNGGSEETVEEGKYPFNRSFMHIEEIQQVPGVTEDIYNILKSHITVYGSKGLNINYASQGILEALFLPPIIVDEIIRRTTIGSSEYAPFENVESFCEYLTERSLTFCEDFREAYQTLEVFQFNTVSHFRVEGLASSRKIVTSTESLLFDPLQAIENHKKSVDIEKKLQKEKSNTQDDFPGKEKEKKKQEDKVSIPKSIAPLPFFIMYWKENL